MRSCERVPALSEGIALDRKGSDAVSFSIREVAEQVFEFTKDGSANIKWPAGVAPKVIRTCGF